MAPFEWRSFPTRAIITPETAKVPKRLRSVQRKTELEIKLDHDFEEIILACQRGESDFVWLTLPLIDVYREVHRHGFVATVGTYRDGQLVGGLWGITVGRTFGVMSIFHRENNAGALAMAAVSDIILSDGRWSVVDCGGINSNFERYGATEIPLEQFCEVVWQTLKVPTSHDHVLQ
jgi:leucyl/phenylalanyl-tRNA--protein transferase